MVGFTAQPDLNDALREAVGPIQRLLDIARLNALGDRTAPLDGTDPPLEWSAATRAKYLRSLHARRDAVFGTAINAGFAWEILLDMLIQHVARNPVSVSSVCIGSGGPPTTALRGIKMLTEAGLIRRICDPFDKRRVYLNLTELAVEKILLVLGDKWDGQRQFTETRR